MANLKRSWSFVVSIILVVMAAIAIQTSGYAQLLSSPRIKPLEASEWTDVERDALGASARGVDTIHVLSTLVRNPDLTRVVQPFAGYIEGKTSTLPRRDREILILRTAWLCRDGYVWSAHSMGFKRAAGGTDEELDRITKGPKAKGWSETLAEKYNDKQLLDAIFTVGDYTMFAMYINSAGVQLEKNWVGLPK